MAATCGWVIRLVQNMAMHATVETCNLNKAFLCSYRLCLSPVRQFVLTLIHVRMQKITKKKNLEV